MQATKQTKLYSQLLYEVTKEAPQELIQTRISDFVKTIGKKKGVKWRAILDSFSKTFDEKEGIMEVHVTARHHMDSDEKRDVLEFAKELYPDKQFVIIDHLDDSVVGGCKVQIEDRLFDFTVKNSLAALHKRLTQ